MDKEKYLKARRMLHDELKFHSSKEKLSDKEKQYISALRQEINMLSEERIEAGKPCNIGDVVEITLNSGRVVKGKVAEFHLVQGDVFICAYHYFKNKTKSFEATLRYITADHLDVKIIEPCI